MPRVLIIDDDSKICEALSEILEEEGYRITATQSAEKGLRMISKQDFDVVLVDLVMPKISGMDVLSYAKRIKPRTHVVMITAFGTIENAVEAMKKGASDYIPKPFKIDEIQASIRRVLEEAKFNNIRRRAEIPTPAETSSEEVQNILDSLANPIRRGVVELLGEWERSSFTDIKKDLKIDDPTKLSFHLRKLKQGGMVEQDEEKRYTLSNRGKKAVEILCRLKSSHLLETRFPLSKNAKEALEKLGREFEG
jgi:FixJ family two-component response regulator